MWRKHCSGAKGAHAGVDTLMLNNPPHSKDRAILPSQE